MILIEKSEKNILVCYDAVIKKQGGGGRVWPNPFPEHIGKRAKVIIYDEDCQEEPERIAIQIQNQLKTKPVD
ncbi:DUF2080 family transposase-associated protein [Methanococcus maripaludis]|uniref:Transposon-encoded protein n=2 Tax=Methanococcus maripaludis TaxID=39152 RepID=A6VJD3_METM7|nr:DUF2080 family transposase-associated protein [Methanococcus maripaludis]MBA2862912.1 putative transposon-encoded protein [Methanococcus maripaludis]